MEFCLLARLLIHISFFFLQDFWIQHSCIYLRWGVWENFQISREGMIAVSSLRKCRCDLQFIIWICDTLLDWIDPYFSRLPAPTEFLSQSQKLRSPQRMKPRTMGLAVRRKQMLPTHHLRRLPPPKMINQLQGIQMASPTRKQKQRSMMSYDQTKTDIQVSILIIALLIPKTWRSKCRMKGVRQMQHRQAWKNTEMNPFFLLSFLGRHFFFLSHILSEQRRETGIWFPCYTQLMGNFGLLYWIFWPYNYA